MTEEDLRKLPLGERVRRVRGDLSHDALAGILGTSRQRVIGWEKHGARPSRRYAQKLADYSGLPVDVFEEPRQPRASLDDVAVQLGRMEGLLDELSAVVRRRPIELAEEIIPQLDAGKQFPAEDLERLADAVEAVGRLTEGLARRLREGARGATGGR